MRIAIYGISRSGKDYLIKKIVEAIPNRIVHIKGSAELGKISLELYNVSFGELNEDRKKLVRKEFVYRLSKYEIENENIVVDGHYSFPDDGKFKVVFDDADYDAYDIVFYIKRSENTIKRQTIKSNKQEFTDYLLSDNNADKWQNFEISNMMKKYNMSNKDFYVLDEDMDNSISFIIYCLSNNCSSTVVTNHIVEKISKDLENTKIILLADLDKTISINDSTYDYIEFCNLDKTKVKSIFYGDYYTLYQQFSFHNYLQSNNNVESAVKYASKKINLNIELISSIVDNRPNNSLIIGLTTGIADIWHIVNDKINLFDIIIGNSYSNKEINEIVTKKIKGILSKTLVKDGYNVVAIGDSIIDIPMLQNSNKGYIIINRSLDKRIELEKESTKGLYQISFSENKYDNIMESDKVW